MLREAWTIAIETLSWIEMHRLNERAALMRTVKQLGVSNPSSVRFAYGLVIETERRKNLIDKFVNSVTSPKNIAEFTLGVQAFLRLYVYQNRIARNWGEINLKEAESIASIGRAILGWQIMRETEPYLGFLLTRNMDLIMANVSEVERLSYQTFHPEWFVEYCLKLFGHDEAVSFLKGSLKLPPNYVRLNTLRRSEEKIIQKLREENVELERIIPLEFTYKVLTSKKPLNALHSYAEGLFYVQDKASCFATQAATPKIGSRVLDFCAAPGAKTTFLAQLMQNQGEIYSIDFSPRRMKTWKKEIARMGVKIADPIVADLRIPLPILEDADVVVLDPPCTSTGVFAKQPSAKWRLSPRSIENMAEIQWLLISNCAERVADGGFLCYSTCSVTFEENEGIIERFLKEHHEFSLVDIEPKIGLPGLKGLTKCQRLYPNTHQCNGFFVAKMQKEFS